MVGWLKPKRETRRTNAQFNWKLRDTCLVPRNAGGSFSGTTRSQDPVRGSKWAATSL